MQFSQPIKYNEAANRIQNACILLGDMQETLSKLIARRLRELGITKSELARQTNLSRQYLGNIINETAPTQSGQYQPSPETVEKLAAALQISREEILSTMDYLPVVDSPSDEQDIKMLFHGAEKWSKVKRKKIVQAMAQHVKTLDELIPDDLK